MSARNAYEYHLHNWSDIQEHLPKLYAAAKGTCLEIGVRSGVSTSALLAGIEQHGGHLYSMDINDCAVFSGHPQWTFRRADSLKENPYPELEEIDVLFVDGDHSYEGCLSDLSRWGGKAKRIFVHDTDAPDFPGVRKAVEQYGHISHRKPLYHHGSYGMAEIR